MTIKDDVLPGSFKGVPFLISKSSVSGGRKDVLHEFPNSNRQTIEDLGLLPRSFTVKAILNADTDNENYLQRRDALLAALEQGGAGVLVHPLYGQIENVVCRSYTADEEFTALGDGAITINFAISDDLGVPVVSQTTLSAIEQANDDFQAAAVADIAENFNVDTFNLNSMTDALATGNDMISSFQASTNVIQAAADEIDTFNSQLSEMTANIVSLVQAPQNLADSIDTTFNLIDSLYPTVEATVNVLTGLFGFNDGVELREESTVSRKERNQNDLLFRASMQSMSLGWAYFNTAQIEFETVEDIEAAADVLEAQFQKVIAADGFTDATKSRLIDLRTLMQRFFDDQKLTARQLITVKSNLTSCRLLSFQYYGHSGEGERIGSLNNTDDITFIEGNLTILTA